MAEYEALIDELVRKHEEFNRIRETGNWVTIKRGKVVRKSDFAPEDFQIGEEYIPRGNFYSPLSETISAKRTVFKKKPVVISSERYYLELKGYGRNGKELFFQEHVDGDVYYGMYLCSAIKEFERSEIAAKLNLSVALPIAVVQIP